MKLSSWLRRYLPLLLIIGFLASVTTACVVVPRTGSSRHSVKHGKHQHRHCHNKGARKAKKHKKHKKHKRHQVCHRHNHKHPHH